jgi:hypothetical protein
MNSPWIRSSARDRLGQQLFGERSLRTVTEGASLRMEAPPRIAVISAALPGLVIRQNHIFRIFRVTRRKAICMSFDCHIGGNVMGEANAFFHHICQTPLLLQ